MYAFTPNAPLSAAKPAVGDSSFTNSLHTRDERKSTMTGPTMVNYTKIRTTVKPTKYYSGVNVVLSKADQYMASSVRRQYLAMSNATGVFGLQCTEGTVQGAADFARVRALNSNFRNFQAGPSRASFNMFENRKEAIVRSHGCHHEETQFCDFKNVASTYNVSQSEALGQCYRYTTPESVVEAAMVRYMDIQQNNAANPTGVYNTACNEGAARGQAEDIRVAALATAYRQGQKSTLKLLAERYEQKRAGHMATHGCNYEEGLVNKYPSLGAAFRSKTYGF